MTRLLETYFKYPSGFLDVNHVEPRSSACGYFKFGESIVCYGRTAEGSVAQDPLSISYDAAKQTSADDSRVQLPFDFDEIVANLYYERYTRKTVGIGEKLVRRTIRHLYYTLRPSLPFSIKTRLQKRHLRGWESLPFPHWPVDTTVDRLMRSILELSLSSGHVTEIPFIWFWPEGLNACAIMTHDVESEAGLELSRSIIEIDESYGIPASFQIVPEERYPVTAEYLDEIRSRGFELNVQDLNHDGRLFDDFERFKARAGRINSYKARFASAGFRSAILYRDQEWFAHLDFDYDMSVPNVAHLDPQRGGCCTVLPYFIGSLVELPVTATQDYTLFHILEKYDLDLWRRQVSLILEYNGLISFIIHPDYIKSTREQRLYQDLLKVLVDLKQDAKLWFTFPREVSAWWKQRSQMQLKQSNGRWRIEGPGSERAVVAFARVESGRLVLRVESRSLGHASGSAGVRATSMSN